MRMIRQTVGISDKYNRGKVVFIDFTYQDYVIVWVEYKAKCVGYLWGG